MQLPNSCHAPVTLRRAPCPLPSPAATPRHNPSPPAHLLEEAARLPLGQPLLLLHILLQVAAAHKLHHDGQPVRGDKHLLERHDVRVRQQAVVEQLALHILGVEARPQLDELDGHLLACA